MKTLNEYIRDRLGGVVDELWCDLSLEAGAEYGDITPEQALNRDELLDNLADLMEEVIDQNTLRLYTVEFRATITVNAKSKDDAYTDALNRISQSEMECIIDGNEY